MTHGHRTDAAAGAGFIQRGPKETRLDFVRRRELMLAGWENDHAARERLGSVEQATWWAGRCAADPALIHPYGPTRNGKSLGYGSWSDDILAMRAAFADTPPPTVAGTDARETTRELSEAELGAIDARAVVAMEDADVWRWQWDGIKNRAAAHIAGLDPQTVRALVAGYRRAKP